MPAYNAASYIRQAAESVLRQSYLNLELIIVDDGSRDQTVMVARDIAAADSRVVLIEQENSGRPSIARNRGIAQASGDYLCFLDSDDYWLPGRLAALVEGLQAHPEWVAAFHDLSLVSFDDHPFPGTYLGNAGFLGKAQPYLRARSGDWHECGDDFFIFMSLHYAALHTQAVLIDRRRFDDAGLRFDEHFTICEDTDLWIRIAMHGRIGYLDRVLSCYRQHPNSITKDTLLLTQEALRFHQYNRQRLEPRLSKGQRAAYDTKIAGFIRQLAYQHYRNGDLRQARALSLQTFRAHLRWIDLATAVKTLLPLTWQRTLRARLTRS
jgi:glycosyltransferase involved in cell wall biosynthesis